MCLLNIVSLQSASRCNLPVGWEPLSCWLILQQASSDFFSWWRWKRGKGRQREREEKKRVEEGEEKNKTLVFKAFKDKTQNLYSIHCIPLKHTHTHTHTVEFSLQVKQLHSAAPPDRYCNLECSWSVWCILFISLQILKNKGTPGWNLIKLVIFSVLSRVFLRKTEFLLFWDCADEAYNDSPPPAQDSLVPPPWSMAPAVLPTFVFCNINANINTVKKANNASAQL